MTDLDLGTSSQVNRLNSLWNAERVDRLRELHSAKPVLSFSQIAARISNEFGVYFTRNAIISKANRIGLDPRGQRSIVTREAGSAAPRKTYTRRIVRANIGGALKVIDSPSSAPFEVRVAEEAKPQYVPLTDLTPGDGRCRYPYGDGPFTFCGCTAVPGISYCAPHKMICSEPYVRRVMEAGRAA